MNGTGKSSFAPYGMTTRGMIATILHRLEGSPSVSITGPFKDVAAGKYYTGAVVWAEQNGGGNGYGSGWFGPDDAVTREQMAVSLYRYAKYKGYDVSDTPDLSAFTDDGEISFWAKKRSGMGKRKCSCERPGQQS